MTSPDIDPALRPHLDLLEQRQAAFYEARLVSDEMRGELRALVRLGWDALRGARVRDVVDPAALGAALDAAVSKAAQRGAIRPISERAIDALRKELASDDAKLSTYVPEETRAKIDRLLERPKLIPEKLVREVLVQDAVEEVLRDVLHDALVTFSSKVNPFFAEWGLPALLKRVMPFGAGAVMKSLETVKGEFDKRLEPETKRFLLGFSHAALKRAADQVVAGGDDPNFIALRKEVARFILDQSVADVVAMMDPETSKLADEIGLDIAEHVAGLESTRKRRARTVDALLAEHGEKTVGAALHDLGVTLEPDLDALTDAAWPLVRTLFASEPVRGWIRAQLRAFFATL